MITTIFASLKSPIHWPLAEQGSIVHVDILSLSRAYFDDTRLDLGTEASDV
jgi:hypothetical protein